MWLIDLWNLNKDFLIICTHIEYYFAIYRQTLLQSLSINIFMYKYMSNQFIWYKLFCSNQEYFIPITNRYPCLKCNS